MSVLDATGSGSVIWPLMVLLPLTLSSDPVAPLAVEKGVVPPVPVPRKTKFCGMVMPPDSCTDDPTSTETVAPAAPPKLAEFSASSVTPGWLAAMASGLPTVVLPV